MKIIKFVIFIVAAWVGVSLILRMLPYGGIFAVIVLFAFIVLVIFVFRKWNLRNQFEWQDQNQPKSKNLIKAILWSIVNIAWQYLFLFIIFSTRIDKFILRKFDYDSEFFYFGTLVGSVFIAFISSIFLIFWFYKLLGRPIERSAKIKRIVGAYLIVSGIIFLTMLLGGPEYIKNYIF